MQAYRFFDRTVALSCPATIQSAWDLLYGAFAVEAELPVDFHFDVREEGSAFAVRFGDATWSATPHRDLARLQELVQNQVIGSVRSHLLWHGASWLVDGGGMVLLADAGVGKSTLSLAWMRSGGRVLSDEVAAWNLRTAMLESFPRAMAVHADSLQLCGMEAELPLLALDEEKHVIGLSTVEGAFPLRNMVVLEWPVDEREASPFVVELHVHADSQSWIDAVRNVEGVSAVVSHPDGGGWWRVCGERVLKPGEFEPLLASAGAVLSGHHTGAFRRPDYRGAPVLKALPVEDLARRSLMFLLNARGLAASMGPGRLMGEVRRALTGVAGFRVVPGELNATREALRALCR